MENSTELKKKAYEEMFKDPKIQAMMAQVEKDTKDFEFSMLGYDLIDKLDPIIREMVEHCDVEDFDFDKIYEGMEAFMDAMGIEPDVTCLWQDMHSEKEFRESDLEE